MSNSWLTAESFDRSQRLVQMVNTLAIHVKLTLAGMQDEKRAGAAEQAREELRGFLANLAQWLAEAEDAPEPLVMGIDPRLHQLVTRVVTQRKQWPRRSLLSRLPMEHALALLDATKPAEMEQLLEWLQELRALLEDHLHTDLVSLLGEGI